MMRAVVVDDSPEMVKLLVRLCEKSGITVVGKAYSGAEAIKLCKNVDFDILIIDLHLPDASGYMVAKEITAYKKDAKIIIVTSDDDFITADFTVLRKPFERQEFNDAVTNISFDNERKS